LFSGELDYLGSNLSGNDLAEERIMRTIYYFGELENMYVDELNEIYGWINVCGMEYPAGKILRNVDEVAFRCGVWDWVSEYYEELRDTDLTADEQAHYGISNTATVYCHKDETED
jgi:hypothetical protein